MSSASRRSPPIPRAAARSRPAPRRREGTLGVEARRPQGVGRVVVSPHARGKRPRARRMAHDRRVPHRARVGSPHGPGAHGPAERARRLVPDERVVVGAHARRRDHDLRGAAARPTRTCSSTSTRACTSCRASARSSRIPPIETGRPFWIDDPTFNLEYHVRHSALPSPGSEEQLPQHRGAGLLAAARPHQAALGAVARPGPDAQALRDRSRRPITRSSTASRASTSRPCCST